MKYVIDVALEPTGAKVIHTEKQKRRTHEKHGQNNAHITWAQVKSIWRDQASMKNT